MGTWTIYKGSRLETLLDALVQRLREQPAAPLEQETIVVQGQGMARWLERELAQRLGIAGSFRFPYPGAFLYSLLLRDEPAPSPFGREALGLRIFRLLADPRLQDQLGAAATFCEDDPDQRKRSQLAAALAQRFDDYQLYRTDLLAAFAKGRAVDLLHADWQGALWRALLRERPGLDDARRIDALQDTLRRERPASLPARVTLFALPALPQAMLDVLRGIERHCDIAQFALLPSLGFLEDQRKLKDGDEVQSPLIAALGRPSRELFAQLLDLEEDDAAPCATTELAEAEGQGETLLSFVQQDLADLVSPADRKGERRLAADDDSLRVHSAHSPLREMEILRDQLLDFFAKDKTLKPQDALILVPDMEEYGPLVEAAFAPVRAILRPHIADRNPQGELRAPRLALRLFAIAGSRYSVFDLLPLLDEPAVAARFGIAAAQSGAARDLLEQARVRWGIDGLHRQQSFGVPNDDANSWRRGLERLLLGVATGPLDDLALGLLPQSDETLARSDLLSSLLAFFETVHECARSFGEPGTLPEWVRRVEHALTSLFAPQTEEDRRGLHEVHKALRRLRELAAVVDEEGSPLSLPPVAMQQQLEAHFHEAADGRGFLFGALNVAALRPMRAVPVRILALAGLHDGSFPRMQLRHEFDLMASGRRPGDPDRRSEDRQLFLDALLAARQKLVLSYVGRSSKDNTERAPSPVLAELLDCLDQTATTPDGRSVREHVLVDHPLQSWSPRYGGEDPRLFTYSQKDQGSPLLDLARQANPPKEPEPQDGVERIAIDDLASFWSDPPAAAARALGLAFAATEDEDGQDDSEPFASGPLEQFQAMQQQVRRRLSQPSADASQDQERLLQTGMLPSGHLGHIAAPPILNDANSLAAAVAAYGSLRDLHVEIRGADYVVHGDLSGLTQDARIEWRPGSWTGVKCIAPFVRHVAMLAFGAEAKQAPRSTILCGLEDNVVLGPMDDPLQLLDLLVQGRRTGLHCVLPLPPKAAMKAAATLHKEADGANAEASEEKALAAAAKIYARAGDYGQDHDHDLPNPALEFFFRDANPIEDPEFLHWVHCVYARLHGLQQKESREP